MGADRGTRVEILGRCFACRIATVVPFLVAVVLATVVTVGATGTGAEAQTGCSLGAAVSTNAAIAQAECDAIVDLYRNTNGPGWADNTGWIAIDNGGQTNPCDWQGIACVNNRIAELRIFVNELSGEIPASLGELTDLQSLSLWGNSLAGSIPGSLGDLSNLELLDLDDNELSGSIPASLGNIVNLRDLTLGSNDLSGSLPGSLGDLSNLESLDLEDNELSGSIPASLGSLVNLRDLNLASNDLSGEIPASLGDLAKLQSLALSWNRLSGEIPASLGDLANLGYLSLYENELAGQVPGSLSGLPLSGVSSLRLQGNGCLTADAATEAWMAATFDAQFAMDALEQNCDAPDPDGAVSSSRTTVPAPVPDDEVNSADAEEDNISGEPKSGFPLWPAGLALVIGALIAGGIGLRKKGLSGSKPESRVA